MESRMPSFRRLAIATATATVATACSRIPVLTAFSSPRSGGIPHHSLPLGGIGGFGIATIAARLEPPHRPSSAISASKGGGSRRRRQQSSQRQQDSQNNGGFGQTSDTESPSSSSSSSSWTPTPEGPGGATPGGGNIYSLPALYDLAFGYRDYDDEVEFLLSLHDEAGAGTSTTNEHGLRILELAAGPARHSLTALATRSRDEVQSAAALDLSRDMIEYGSGLANDMLGESGGDDSGDEDGDGGGSTSTRRDDFKYAWGMMHNAGDALISDGDGDDDDDGDGGGTTLKTLPKFDTAWLLLGSMQHLLTNDAVISTFESVSSLLRDDDGGTLILELPHPRETFAMGECTRNGWTVPLEGDDGEESGQLDVVWGDEDDVFDPVRQVRDFTVEMKWSSKSSSGGDDDEKKGGDDGGDQSAREVVPLRLFTMQEINALARCAGFEVAATYGALDTERVSMDEEEGAYRMVCVLRKKKP